MPNRHVVPNPRGGWSVKVPTKPVSESDHRTQAAAEEAAKRTVRQQGGGQVIIHRPDGIIRDGDTVGPVRDPHPPRDTKR